MLVKISLIGLLIGGLHPSLMGQDTRLFDRVFMDQSTYLLEDSILETSRKHAIYSYNLANATTPGFEPILPEADRREIFEMAPPGSEYFSKVMVEHMTAAMAKNRGRQSAYYALYKKKIENYRMVMTFGKK